LIRIIDEKQDVLDGSRGIKNSFQQKLNQAIVTGLKGLENKRPEHPRFIEHVVTDITTDSQDHSEIEIWI